MAVKKIDVFASFVGRIIQKSLVSNAVYKGINAPRVEKHSRLYVSTIV